MKPLHTGLSLSITVAIFYSLCTVIEVTWPVQFMGFMNALFHGLDFSDLSTSEPFSWASYFYALVVLAVWAFAIGVMFAWLYNTFSGLRVQHIVCHEQP